MARKKGDGVPLVRVSIAIDRRDLWKICRIAKEEGVGHTTWIRERLIEALAEKQWQLKERRARRRSAPTRGSKKRTSTPVRDSKTAQKRHTAQAREP
jgi:hypothetical protein